MITHYSSIFSFFFHFFCFVCSISDDEFFMPMSCTEPSLSGTLLVVAMRELCTSGNIIFSFCDWQFSSSCSIICFIGIAWQLADRGPFAALLIWFDLSARNSLFRLDCPREVQSLYLLYYFIHLQSTHISRSSHSHSQHQSWNPSFNSILNLIFSFFLFNSVQIIEFCFLFRWKNANKYDDDWENDDEEEEAGSWIENAKKLFLQNSSNVCVSECFLCYFVINWNLFVIIDHFYIILNENIFKTIINL